MPTKTSSLTIILVDELLDARALFATFGYIADLHSEFDLRHLRVSFHALFKCFVFSRATPHFKSMRLTYNFFKCAVSVSRPWSKLRREGFSRTISAPKIASKTRPSGQLPAKKYARCLMVRTERHAANGRRRLRRKYVAKQRRAKASQLSCWIWSTMTEGVRHLIEMCG